MDCMICIGNMEWTSTVFDETSTSYSHDMNSDNSYMSEESDQDVLRERLLEEVLGKIFHTLFRPHKNV